MCTCTRAHALAHTCVHLSLHMPLCTYTSVCLCMDAPVPADFFKQLLPRLQAGTAVAYADERRALLRSTRKAKPTKQHADHVARNGVPKKGERGSGLRILAGFCEPSAAAGFCIPFPFA